MLKPPTFASEKEYIAQRTDVDFWRPFVIEILARYKLIDARRELVTGVGGTFPTFLYGDVVVKLFGFLRSWHKSYTAEYAAHTLLASDPRITAPSLLAAGRLFDDDNAAWPYLISSRLAGVSWYAAELTGVQQLEVAADLGRQIRRVHALRPFNNPALEDWPRLDMVTAVTQSSLPPHLGAQVDDFLARLGPFDRTFVHGDLFARHVFVENGNLVGIIDWGDAIVTDRHYELAKLHLDTFDGDKTLLRVFLEASEWPVETDFALKALGLALYRQAMGFVQHFSNDTFHKLPALLPLQDIETLDELANELFAV
ncbi:MAG: aminoglycoside phosphotransferase family protein [Anaerolineales bacterium]|nr:aminoglycoside phosphotransferase family protein [Anaerolineales bacterium]